MTLIISVLTEISGHLSRDRCEIDFIKTLSFSACCAMVVVEEFVRGLTGY
jgi:hypothetical protein